VISEGDCGIRLKADKFQRTKICNKAISTIARHAEFISASPDKTLSFNFLPFSPMSLQKVCV